MQGPTATWQHALGQSQHQGAKGSNNRRGRRGRKEGKSQEEEPTCKGNREFLFILPVVMLQGGFELLPNIIVNYFNFSPRSP